MEIRTAETQSQQRKEGKELIAYLRSAIAIRERCGQLFVLATEDKLPNFGCDLMQLDSVADYVISVMRGEYPNLDIPFHSRWRHFEASGVRRLTLLDEMLVGMTPLEKAMAKFDLAIISVLLDAGAGNSWRYYEHETNLGFRRSEGLAVASFRMFCQGAFSSEQKQSLKADAQKLQLLTEEELADGFQVNAQNPLVGVSGRLKLLQKLGQAIVSSPDLFGEVNPRPGNMVNYLMGKSENHAIAATTVFDAVLEGLSDIWSGRVEVAGVNLGDVWFHPAVSDDGLVPFHKLSQWLTYSLLEPLQELGLEITNLDALTGLPEYRNGGCVSIWDLSASKIRRFCDRLIQYHQKL